MKLLIIFFLSIPNIIYAQTNAVTESGKEVILLNDGTWKYTNSKIIYSNKSKFTKNSDAFYLVKSKKINIGVWLDPLKWSFYNTPKEQEEIAEYEFRMEDSYLSGILLYDKEIFSKELLKEQFYENILEQAPNTKIIKEEYRYVNEAKVLLVQMTGTIKDVNFVYYGYYYSNLNGSVILQLYTADDTFKGQLDDIELFLNGFVEL